MRRTTALGWIALLTALGAGAAAGAICCCPAPASPASVTLLQGDGQNGRVGEALPQPLIVGCHGCDRPAGRRRHGRLRAHRSGARRGGRARHRHDQRRRQGHAQVVLGTRPGTSDG